MSGSLMSCVRDVSPSRELPAPPLPSEPDIDVRKETPKRRKFNPIRNLRRMFRRRSQPEPESPNPVHVKNFGTATTIRSTQTAATTLSEYGGDRNNFDDAAEYGVYFSHDQLTGGSRAHPCTVAVSGIGGGGGGVPGSGAGGMESRDMVDCQRSLSEGRLIDCDKEELSKSHDSIFSESATTSSISITLKAELTDVLRKRRIQPENSEEELSLSHSSTAQPHNEHHTLSQGSLSITSSDMDDDYSLSQNESLSGYLAKTYSDVSRASDDVDLEVSSSSRLNHAAAKHKMAVKPKKKNRPKRPREPKLLPTTPEVNEEALKIEQTAQRKSSFASKFSSKPHVAPKKPEIATKPESTALPAPSEGGNFVTRFLNRSINKKKKDDKRAKRDEVDKATVVVVSAAPPSEPQRTIEIHDEPPTLRNVWTSSGEPKSMPASVRTSWQEQSARISGGTPRHEVYAQFSAKTADQFSPVRKAVEKSKSFRDPQADKSFAQFRKGDNLPSLPNLTNNVYLLEDENAFQSLNEYMTCTSPEFDQNSKSETFEINDNNLLKQNSSNKDEQYDTLKRRRNLVLKGAEEIPTTGNQNISQIEENIEKLMMSSIISVLKPANSLEDDDKTPVLSPDPEKSSSSATELSLSQNSVEIKELEPITFANYSPVIRAPLRENVAPLESSPKRNSLSIYDHDDRKVILQRRTSVSEERLKFERRISKTEENALGEKKKSQSEEGLDSKPSNGKKGDRKSTEDSGGGVVLRKKPPANENNSDGVPELMKVFARRSLKLYSDESSDSDPVPATNEKKKSSSLDSDKENHSNSEEKLNEKENIEAKNETIVKVKSSSVAIKPVVPPNSTTTITPAVVVAAKEPRKSLSHQSFLDPNALNNNSCTKTTSLVFEHNPVGSRSDPKISNNNNVDGSGERRCVVSATLPLTQADNNQEGIGIKSILAEWEKRLKGGA